MNNEREVFHNSYQKLKKLIAQSQSVFEKLQMKEETLYYKNPRENFRLLIMGKRRGDRIDFINSLIGREVLSPSVYSDASSNIEIKWSEKEKAIVYFNSDLQEKLPYPESILEHIKIHGYSVVPPCEIPIKELEEAAVLRNVFDRIQIMIPDNFFMDGIEFIDIPDINKSTLIDMLEEYNIKIPVDLILYIISDEEIKGIIKSDGEELINRSSFNNIFYVCSIDEDMGPHERYSVLKFLKNATRFRDEGVFFLSGQKQRGKSNDNSGEIIIESNIYDVINAVCQEQRRENFYKPLYELTRVVKEAILKIIAELYITAEENAQNIEMIFNRSTAAVRRALIHKGNMNSKISASIEQIRNQIEEEIRGFMKGLPERLRKYIENMNIKHSRNIHSEAYRMIEEQIDMELYEWTRSRVIPLIDGEVKTTIKSEAYNFKSFCYEIDNINRDFSKARGVKQPVEKYVSAMEKYAGLFKIGEKDEISEYVKNINEGLVSKIIFSRNKCIVNPECIYEVIFDADNPGDLLLNAIANNIEKNSDSIIKFITDEILKQVEVFFEYIKARLNLEIEKVEDKVGFLQEYKNRLQNATDRISECEKELKEIDRELIELVFEAMGA